MSAALVLGTKKGFILLEKGSRSWRAKPLQLAGMPVSYAFHDARTKTFWAAIDHGHWGCKIQKSPDGATWTEVAAPKYPEGCAAAPCTKKPATLRYIYALAAGRKEEPNRLYAGTVPGGLFVSEDSGASWSLVDSLWNHSTRTGWFQGGKDFEDPGTHSIVIDPRDPKKILVGMSSGGCFGTNDGGKTWEARNKGLKNDYAPDSNAEVGFDPHFVQCCESQPEVVWQQNHCGVFRSTDFGKTWHDVGDPKVGVRFGFAVAADAKDAKRAWLVPLKSDENRSAIDGALRVARTDDGGKSWSIFREGLPQENAYDAIYRHALDARGDLVAFGTTTGNLYASEDRGESWHCLGTSFPPILTVRYA